MMHKDFAFASHLHAVHSLVPANVTALPLGSSGSGSGRNGHKPGMQDAIVVKAADIGLYNCPHFRRLKLNTQTEITHSHGSARVL